MFLKKPALRPPAWMNGVCKLPGLMPVTAGISCSLPPPVCGFPIVPGSGGRITTHVFIHRQRFPCGEAALCQGCPEP